MSILIVICIGLLVGITAKLLTPGKDPGGLIMTALLGVAAENLRPKQSEITTLIGALNVSHRSKISRPTPVALVLTPLSWGRLRLIHPRARDIRLAFPH